MNDSTRREGAGVVWIRASLAAMLAGTLTGCMTLYSTDRSWKLPGTSGSYSLSARMNIGLLTREATISVNGRELLRGSSYFWSDRIHMSGTLEGLPIDADCSEGSRACKVTIAGLHAATLAL